MLEQIVEQYHELLYPLAELAASSLELIGIALIMAGSFRSLVHLIRCRLQHQPIRVGVSLGRALSLALEFKMGAEIIKTVIIHDLKELVILGVVIAIRALLAVVIHWEIHMERKEERD